MMPLGHRPADIVTDTGTITQDAFGRYGESHAASNCVLGKTVRKRRQWAKVTE